MNGLLSEPAGLGVGRGGNGWFSLSRNPETLFEQRQG